MKKLKSIIIYIAVACLLLTGCGKNDTKIDANKIIKSSSITTNEELEKYENEDDFILNVWSDSLDKSYIEGVFNELYPNAIVNVVNIDGENSDKICESLAAGNAPDVVMYYSDQFGKFNSIDGFEDLSQSKYDINEIKHLFSKQQLDQCMSLDGKKLIALPFTTGSMVTYYRSDILAEHGIPTEPNALGDFMEKPEGWLTIAKELKKDNIWALQWKDELIKIAIKEYGYFDKDLLLKLDNKSVKDAVSVSSEALKSALIGNYNIKTEDGKKAIRDGKIAMLYLNRSGEDYLKEVAPETAGEWRATRLPLGIYSYSDTNNISISASSKHKKQAWELVKKLIEKDRSHYESIKNQQNEFLGGQKSQLLYKELDQKLPMRYGTILDEKVDYMFIENIDNYLSSDMNSQSILNTIKLKISNSIDHEQKALSEYIKAPYNIGD